MQQLRVTYVAGVVPGKWIDRFSQRYPHVELIAERLDEGDTLEQLAAREADVVFVRFTPGQSPKNETRHVIPLYEELEVICAARDHDVEYYDETIPLAEAAEYPALDLGDYPEEAGGVAMAMEVVATGAFVARMPMSLARLHARKDVIHRVIEGGQPSQIGIAWLVDCPQPDLVDEFIGVVRGRGANSSRQASVREREQRTANSRQRGEKPGGSAKGSQAGTANRAAKPKPKPEAKPRAARTAKGRKRR